MANSDAGDQVVPEQPGASSPEKRPASPHDTFVYRILSDPALAAAEIKAVLPEKICAEIAWEELEVDQNRFVTGNLDNQYTDLLFKTTIRRREIRIRILLEHSSHAKPFELLQTLQYQVRQWERDLQQKKEVGNPQRLTPILTIILHHSKKGWRGRTRFIDYYGLDADLAELLRPYVVDFGITLDDISKVNTEALIERPVPAEVRLLLFALRYGRSGRQVLDELPKLAPTLTMLLREPNGRVVLGVFFVYIRKVAQIPEADLRSRLQEFIEPQLDPEMVAVWTQFEAGEKKGRIEGLREGKREGIREGKREGIREGELERGRLMLQKLLAQRFGVLSPAQLARLQSASLDDLDTMTLRVLTAPTADEVLGTR